MNLVALDEILQVLLACLRHRNLAAAAVQALDESLQACHLAVVLALALALLHKLEVVVCEQTSSLSLPPAGRMTLLRLLVGLEQAYKMVAEL